MAKLGIILGFSAIAALIGSPGLAQGLSSPQASQPALNTQPMSYTNPFGVLPKFTPDFWKQFSAARVGPGTVLTAILDDTLSSSNSKTGDIFSLRLQDGYSVDGTEIIPKQSRIIGTVISAKSARLNHTGMPGSLDISLQTLVFPDGRTTPFFGYIEHNPSTDLKHKPGQEPIDVAGLGKKGLSGLLTLGTGRLGMPIRLPNFGQEMRIEKGEAVPIRLSRTLDVAHMNEAPRTVQTPQMPINPLQPDPVSLMQQPGGSVPGLAGSAPGLVSPGMFGPPVPGMAAPPALSLDSMGGPSAAPQRPSLGADIGSGDPNSIFSTPARQTQPQADVGEPF
ncbi:MAG TPA: hypothetical protein V6C69_14710 [Trichormus sp.]|jgi:hypothetical protein